MNVVFFKIIYVLLYFVKIPFKKSFFTKSTKFNEFYFVDIL